MCPSYCDGCACFTRKAWPGALNSHTLLCVIFSIESSLDGSPPISPKPWFYDRRADKMTASDKVTATAVVGSAALSAACGCGGSGGGGRRRTAAYAVAAPRPAEGRGGNGSNRCRADVTVPAAQQSITVCPGQIIFGGGSKSD